MGFGRIFWTIVGSTILVRFNVAQYIFYDIAGKFKRWLVGCLTAGSLRVCCSGCSTAGS